MSVIGMRRRPSIDRFRPQKDKRPGNSRGGIIARVGCGKDFKESGIQDQKGNQERKRNTYELPIKIYGPDCQSDGGGGGNVVGRSVWSAAGLKFH